MDWTHEREWRCPSDVDLAQVGFYVIVWSADEASEVAQLNIPLKSNIFWCADDGASEPDALRFAHCITAIFGGKPERQKGTAPVWLTGAARRVGSECTRPRVPCTLPYKLKTQVQG